MGLAGLVDWRGAGLRFWFIRSCSSLPLLHTHGHEGCYSLHLHARGEGSVLCNNNKKAGTPFYDFMAIYLLCYAIQEYMLLLLLILLILRFYPSNPSAPAPLFVSPARRLYARFCIPVVAVFPLAVHRPMYFVADGWSCAVLHAYVLLPAVRFGIIAPAMQLLCYG